MQKGMNLQNVRQTNRAAVLYLLNANGMLSRKQIAEKLCLTKAALTKITQQLLAEGVIEEKEAIGSGVGRKEVMLSLRFDNSKAMGITFERNFITFSVAGLDGKLEDICNIKFNDDFNKVKKEIRKYYESRSLKYQLIGVGVSIIGQENQYGVFPGHDICKELEKYIPIPIYVKNNVQAFSQAEIIYGDKKEEKNILLFKWGPGIGSSFIRDGKVLSGDDSGITEIGHMIVNPDGKQCRCGRRGCLETETALDVIQEEVNSLGYSLTIDEILSSDEPKIINLLEAKMTIVCLALLNACTVLNSNYIVLFGTVFRNEKFRVRFFKKWEELSSPLKMTMVLSSLNQKSSYVGSIAMVARKLFFEKYI